MNSLREPVPVVADNLGVGWEEVDCLLCGGSKWAPYVEAQDQVALAAGQQGLWFLVVRCPDCGLCFTNPRPALANMARFYPESYAPHVVRAREKHLPWWQKLPWLGRRTTFYRHLLTPFGKGRLLDFGCGGSDFPLRMRRRGWQVTGLDASEEMVARLRAELGLHVLTGSLPHPALDDESFEAVTMWQALEHAHQPLETLRAAHRLLVSGGQILLTTPNIDSLSFRWFRSAWNGLDLPRHLVHFSRPTLRAMLQRAGFSGVRVSMVRRSGWLRDSAQIFHSRMPNSRWPRWLRSRSVSNLLSWYAFCTRQADCLMAVAQKK